MSGIGGLERNRANPRVPGRAGFNRFGYTQKLLLVGVTLNPVPWL